MRCFREGVFYSKTQDKLDPLTVSEEEFCDVVCRKPCNVSRAVYSSLTGISPVVAEEICFRASIDGSDAAQSLDEAARVHLYHTFRRLMDQVVEGFSPNIVYRGRTCGVWCVCVPAVWTGVSFCGV